MTASIISLLIVAAGVLAVLGVVEIIDRIRRRKRDKN